jgi:cell division protein FtsB
MTGPADRRQPPTAKFTGRAAMLAVVICAIALSLAYPVREYLAQSRQIGALEVQHQALQAKVTGLATEQQRLNSPAYIEQQARDNLHMCLPTTTCYVIVDGTPKPKQAAAHTAPPVPAWYEKLWTSVQAAGAPAGSGSSGRSGAGQPAPSKTPAGKSPSGKTHQGRTHQHKTHKGKNRHGKRGTGQVSGGQPRHAGQ